MNYKRISLLLFSLVLLVSTLSGFTLLRDAILQPAHAARFTLLVEEDVYIPGDSLVIYGAGEPNDLLVIRLFGASGRAIQTDTVVTDSNGFFRQTIYQWQEPSKSIPFGSYTIQAISSLFGTDTRELEVTFTEATQIDTSPRIPISHTLGIKLDSPDQVPVKKPFRVFIQVTFDDALVAVEGEEIPELLGLSHIHSGNSTSSPGFQVTLSDKLKRLHEGIYYADVELSREDTYIIHSVAFHRGLLAHDSKVITATSSSISTIQESIHELDSRLDSTNRELAELEEGIKETEGAVNQTRSAITESVDTGIERIQQASGQINSIILPVLALISVIIALQISLFARIRASFR